MNIMLFQASMFCAERANETVEKPIMGRAFPVQVSTERPVSRAEGSFSFFLLCQRLGQRPEHVDLADIVNQGEQPPLYIHFGFGTKGKTVHALVDTEVGENRVSTGSTTSSTIPSRLP